MKIKKLFIVLISVLNGIFLPAYASTSFLTDPSQICPSAKQIGLGKTYAASSQDASSIFLNPAGLASINQKRINSMYTNITDDINYAAFAYAHPTNIGNIGIGLLRIGVDSIYKTSDTETIEDQFNYFNNIFFLSFAKKLNYRTAIGLNLKYVEQNFQNIADGKVSSIGFDLGGTIKLTPKLNFGLAAKNILSTGNENLKKEMKIGLTTLIADNLSFSLDADVQEYYPLTFQSGIGWKPLDFISLRTGIEEAFINSSNKTLNYSLGLGLIFAGINFDYAYYIDNELDYNNRSYFSLGFKLK
jgi:long-subunit fatty acid transport protein